MLGSLIVILSVLLLSGSAQHPSSGRPPIITGISGCINQSTTQTINCQRPATLTLTGSGFLTGLEHEDDVNWFLTISLLSSPDDRAPLWCTALGRAVDASIVCQVPSYGFGKIPPNKLYSVQLMNWLTMNSSVLNNAVSFAAELSPRVDSVRGCSQISPDGRSASQCDVARDHITLVGSGFRNVDGSFATLSLGTASHTFQLIVDNKFLIRIDNDEIVFNFGGSLTFLPAIDAQPGVALSLTLVDGGPSRLWETAPVYIRFLPIPDPVVTSISVLAWTEGCVPDNSTTPTRFSNCINGLSTLSLEGDYFFEPLTITVNGVPSLVQPVVRTSVYFNVPIFDTVEGIYYDVTVTTPAGSVTIPGVIEFNHDPLIYDVVPCIDVGPRIPSSPVTAHCIAGETLTLKVLNIPTSTPRVLFHSARNHSVTMECPSVSRVDGRTITCTTPTMGDSSVWGTYTAVDMWLEWQDGTKSASLPVSPLWDPSNSPRMTSLSGCDSRSGNPLHLDECLGSTSASGTLLTIHGVRFRQPLVSNTTWRVNINAASCDRPTAVNDETLTCVLPNLALQEGAFGGLLYNEKYTVFVQGSANGYSLRTNAGYITFITTPRSSSSSSSTSASTIALATVFSIIGAVLICAGLFYMLRSARGNKKRDALHIPELSSTGQHVELEEV